MESQPKHDKGYTINPKADLYKFACSYRWITMLVIESLKRMSALKVH